MSGIVEYSVQKLRARPCAPHWLFALEIAAAILYRLRGASVSRETKLPLALLAGAPTGVAVRPALARGADLAAGRVI